MPLHNKEIIHLCDQRRLAIGVFDGVHKGHQQLIEKASMVLTFNPHPLHVTAGAEKKVPLLTTMEEKQYLIPFLIVLNFSEEVAAYSPGDFVKRILVDELQVESVIVGYDFVFGRDREGNIGLLKEIGKEYGFSVEVIDKVTFEGNVVKSSYIRELLLKGDVEQASLMLGRDYFMFGQVVPGKRIGRTLGFPTANIMVPPEKLVPAQGVYSGSIKIDDHEYDCAINIGPRTIGIDGLLAENVIEAFIFDFEGDLYGKRVTLYFSRFIRKEKVFDSYDKLKEQIEKDVQFIKQTYELTGK